MDVYSHYMLGRVCNDIRRNGSSRVGRGRGCGLMETVEMIVTGCLSGCKMVIRAITNPRYSGHSVKQPRHYYSRLLRI